MKQYLCAMVLVAALHSPAHAEQMYDTEEAAQASCPSAGVMWLDTANGAYYQQGDPAYGNTREGAYVCPEGSEAPAQPPQTEEQ